jgi:hypothetical protein
MEQENFTPAQRIVPAASHRILRWSWRTGWTGVTMTVDEAFYQGLPRHAYRRLNSRHSVRAGKVQVKITKGEEHMPISKSIVEAAIVGFEHQKTQIDNQIAELRSMLSGASAEPTVATPEAAPGKRKKFSAGARRRMALAQKARWAKIKGEAESPTPVPVVARKAKRKLSAAGRAAIIAATKKMWAAKRAAAKSATKKAAPALALAQKPKRKLSAAGLKAIIASNKKMWERRRAAAKET